MMDKEEAKTILLKILLDLVFVDAMENVPPIIAKHLGLNEQDELEVIGRFKGEIRETFINHPHFPGSDLAKSLNDERS